MLWIYFLYLPVTVLQQHWQVIRLKVHKLVSSSSDSFHSVIDLCLWLWYLHCFLINFSISIVKHSPIKLLTLIDTLRWSPYTFCYLLHPLERDVSNYTAGGQIYNLYIMCWFSLQSRSWSKGFSFFSLLLDNITQALKAEGAFKMTLIAHTVFCLFYPCLWWLDTNSVLSNLLAFTPWLQVIQQNVATLMKQSQFQMMFS